jgi:ubiquinone/menaquinone biosynthesis C-methylase UbiE
MKLNEEHFRDWERDIYAKGEQVNRWPFSELVADTMKAYGSQGCAGRSVLEIGCGTGNNLWFFLEHGFLVAGLDISATAIRISDEYLRSRGFTGFELHSGSAEYLPWPDESFDLVVDRGALTQMKISQVERTLNVVSRVLRPGGLFFSYHLLGLESDDMRLGVPIEPQTMAFFTGGMFQKLPMTTFFSEKTIRDLWHGYFQINELKKIHTINADGTKEERFTVLSRKTP